MNLRIAAYILAALTGNVIWAAGPAVAWNSSGHMIIALAAYDQMKDSAKAAAIELLHAHPRYQDHFERMMPREVRGMPTKEKDAWAFAHASTWPDVVRQPNRGVTRADVRDFSRPEWHYIDIPIYLNAQEAIDLRPQVATFKLQRDPPPGHDVEAMNVIQAVKNSSRIVADNEADLADRSVHLCWLLHLIGDSHQPLHSSALFTTHRFRKGDRGGNDMSIEHNYTLHSFWDSQISTDTPYETIRVLARDLTLNHELMTAVARDTTSLDIGDWIDEGHELAKEYVYTEFVVQKVAAAEGHPRLGDLHPPPSYITNAEQIAERRAVQSAYRTARLLEQLINQQ